MTKSEIIEELLREFTAASEEYHSLGTSQQDNEQRMYVIGKIKGLERAITLLNMEGLKL